MLHMALSDPVYWTLDLFILFFHSLSLVYLSIFYWRYIIYLLMFFSKTISLFFCLSFFRIHNFCWRILFYHSWLDILLCIHILRLNSVWLYFVLWRYDFMDLMNWTFWRYWSLRNFWFILLSTFLLDYSDKILIWFWNRFVFFYLRR